MTSYETKTMTQMPNNYDDTLDYCERLLKTIFEETLTLEDPGQARFEGRDRPLPL